VEAKRKKDLKEMLEKMKDEKMAEIRQNASDLENVDSYRNDAGDFADTATNSFDKELHFELTEKNKRMLMEIEDALAKIENGGYGKCDKCTSPISLERLKALPFAKRCIKCESGKK